MKTLSLLTLAVYFWALAQSYGDSWITMSPTGETLVCIVLPNGATYCEVQK